MKLSFVKFSLNRPKLLSLKYGLALIIYFDLKLKSEYIFAGKISEKINLSIN